MLIEKSFDTGELVINYAESETDGPPLVLLHGSTMRWQRLNQLIPTLEKQWHVFACDLRGHGMSQWGRSGYRLGDYARDTTTFVERCIGQPVIFVGFSLGAMVALATAAKVSHLTRAVVLLEPPLIYRETSLWGSGWPYELSRWIKQTLASTRTLVEVTAQCRELDPVSSDQEIEDLAARVHRLDPQVLEYFLNDRWLEGVDFEQLMSAVSSPVLLLHGESDLGGMVRESDAVWFQECVPHSAAIQIKGAGHGIVREAPGQTALAHLTGFLDSHIAL